MNFENLITYMQSTAKYIYIRKKISESERKTFRPKTIRFSGMRCKSNVCKPATQKLYNLKSRKSRSVINWSTLLISSDLNNLF